MTYLTKRFYHLKKGQIKTKFLSTKIALLFWSAYFCSPAWEIETRIQLNMAKTMSIIYPWPMEVGKEKKTLLLLLDTVDHIECNRDEGYSEEYLLCRNLKHFICKIPSSQISDFWKTFDVSITQRNTYV